MRRLTPATIVLVIAFVGCDDQPVVDKRPPEITATVEPIPKIESAEGLAPPPLPPQQTPSAKVAPPPPVRAAPPPEVQREVEKKRASD